MYLLSELELPSIMNQIQIIDNLQHIRTRIAKAASACGRNAADIELIAVSKTKPNEAIESALKAQQFAFGENKIQELSRKMEELPNAQIQWHMIGTLQSNKIKYMAHRVDWIHSIPKIKTLKEVDKRAAQHNRVIKCLIQVNISDEDQKSGCSVAELPSLLVEANSLKNIEIKGLMGIATLTDDQEVIRKEFRLLRTLRDKYAPTYSGNIQLEHLSMGMTNDLEIAIEEGSTMVRIGSAIFGARNVK